MLSGQILQPLLARDLSSGRRRKAVDHRRAEVRLLLDLPSIELAPCGSSLTSIGDIKFEKGHLLGMTLLRISRWKLPILSIKAGTIIGVKRRGMVPVGTTHVEAYCKATSNRRRARVTIGGVLDHGS